MASKRVINIQLNTIMLDKLSTDVTTKLRPAQLFAKRFQLSVENADVKLAMAQERKQKRKRYEESQISVLSCRRFRYYN